MKAAMPIFGDRVSPRFDCAKSFVVATVDGKEITGREKLDATQWTSHERIARLIALGVDTVVCGGIDCRSAESLRRAGITLFSGVTGTSQRNLDALVNGQLAREQVPPPSTPKTDVASATVVSGQKRTEALDF